MISKSNYYEFGSCDSKRVFSLSFGNFPVTLITLAGRAAAHRPAPSEPALCEFLNNTTVLGFLPINTNMPVKHASGDPSQSAFAR